MQEQNHRYEVAPAVQTSCQAAISLGLISKRRSPSQPTQGLALPLEVNAYGLEGVFRNAPQIALSQ
jgi:hypothetical protein